MYKMKKIKTINVWWIKEFCILYKIHKKDFLHNIKKFQSLYKRWSIAFLSEHDIVMPHLMNLFFSVQYQRWYSQLTIFWGQYWCHLQYLRVLFFRKGYVLFGNIMIANVHSFINVSVLSFKSLLLNARNLQGNSICSNRLTLYCT